MMDLQTNKQVEVILNSWEKIFKTTQQRKKVRKAYESVKLYYLSHPHELKPNCFGHFSRSLRRKKIGWFRRWMLKFFEKKASVLEKAFTMVHCALTKNFNGEPSLEERYAIFTTMASPPNKIGRTKRWGNSWLRALKYYRENKSWSDIKPALNDGIIIGYNIQRSQKKNISETIHNNYKLNRQNKPFDISIDIDTSNSNLRLYLSTLIAEKQRIRSNNLNNHQKKSSITINEQLLESECSLVQYKTRNIAQALTIAILLATPFVILGYIADYYILPMLAMTGIHRFVWKFLEIIIRYIQGYSDTIMQYYSLKKEFESGKDIQSYKHVSSVDKIGEKEIKAARAGIIATVLGPLTAILAPLIGIAEASRLYALVATANATADNATSALTKAYLNWKEAKNKLALKFYEAIDYLLKDPYILGNLLGSLAIFIVDYTGRSILDLTLFGFLGVVAIEGLIIGMLDSEIAALYSWLTIKFQNRKWQRLFKDDVFKKALQSIRTYSPQKDQLPVE